MLPRLINTRLGHLWEESERFAKIKTLTVSIEFLKGLQTMALIYLYISMIFIVLTASFFSGLMYALTSYGHTGKIPVDVFVMVTGGIAVLSLAILIWALREKRILKAFNINERIERIIHEHAKGEPHEQHQQ